MSRTQEIQQLLDGELIRIERVKSLIGQCEPGPERDDLLSELDGLQRWTITQAGLMAVRERAASLQRYLRQLASEDLETRGRAKERLVAMLRVDQAGWVFQALMSLFAPDVAPTMRQSAVWIFGQLGRLAQCVVPKLTALVLDRDACVRVNALQALGRIGGPGVLEVLEHRAKVERAGMARAMAVEAWEAVAGRAWEGRR